MSPLLFELTIWLHNELDRFLLQNKESFLQHFVMCNENMLYMQPETDTC